MPKTKNDLKATLWPIMQRVPTYVRLGVRLARDPAIPRKHKMLLYGTAVWQLTPLHFIVSPIPVVGQFDGIVLLLLSLRQMLVHCPPTSAARHFAKLRLAPNQVDDDARVVFGLAGESFRQAGSGARFAGRVATGMGKRMIGRVVGVKSRSRSAERARSRSMPRAIAAGHPEAAQ